MTDSEDKAVMEALAQAEPGWLIEQHNAPPAIPERRTFHGPGVIDTGSGGVLIDPPIPEIVAAAAPEESDSDGGTSNVPNGTAANDLLRWDGSEWVLLAGFTEQSVWICPSGGGTPSEYTILAKPV